ncbi:MAG: cupin domain-containing protein [Methanomicrobiales archaeon]
MREDLKSKVIELVDLIDYQDGSVVSNEIIRKETGTVTIFAFDQGEGLSEHTAPFDAMVQVIDGEAEISIAEQKYNLKAGNMIIMPADIPHAVMAVQKFKMLLTMIKS